MGKKIIFGIVVVAFSMVCKAQSSNDDKAKTLSFIAGGVSIKIPIPDTTFVEVGYENRESMYIFVPQDNRLLGAFVLKSDLPYLFKGDNTSLMSRYALVEVPRGAENMDCEAGDFLEVCDGLKETLGNNISSVTQESEDAFNSRMKSLDLANMQIKLGQPTQLGCLFSKQDIFGLGLVMAYDLGGSTYKMGMTVILMRVKKRLLFVYLYAEYKNDETIMWLRRVGEKWSDEILMSNKL